jgi:TonB family protein
MKKIFHLTYLGILYLTMTTLRGTVYVFGAKPKLIKNKLLVGSLILSLIIIGAKKVQAQNTCYITSSNKPEDNAFIFVEEMPAFPGGSDSCDKFIKNNLQYPLFAVQNKIQGTVYLGFVIAPDGTISKISILRGIGSGCDEEALRIVKLMPKWIPGKKSGKKVWVQYYLPIKFSLE